MLTREEKQWEDLKAVLKTALDQERSMTQNALNAVKNVKYLSSQQKADKFSAEIVTKAIIEAEADIKTSFLICYNQSAI